MSSDKAGDKVCPHVLERQAEKPRAHDRLHKCTCKGQPTVAWALVAHHVRGGCPSILAWGVASEYARVCVAPQEVQNVVCPGQGPGVLRGVVQEGEGPGAEKACSATSGVHT